MKQRYQSPAWISAAMDDAGLTPHEFRVLAHVCRRAGDGSNGRGCDASVASMARVCAMKADTLRGCLQGLAERGWLECTTRPGKPTEYRPSFPLDPSPQTVGVEAYPSPERGVHPSPQTGAEGKPEGNPLKGNQSTGLQSFEAYTETKFPTSGSGQSPPPDARDSGPRRFAISEENAREWARDFHAIEGRDPVNALGIFPPEEVEQWAVDWLLTMEAAGWVMPDGRAVETPKAALRGYLRHSASRHSKRFRELGSRQE